MRINNKIPFFTGGLLALAFCNLFLSHNIVLFFAMFLTGGFGLTLLTFVYISVLLNISGLKGNKDVKQILFHWYSMGLVPFGLFAVNSLITSNEINEELFYRLGLFAILFSFIIFLGGILNEKLVARNEKLKIIAGFLLILVILISTPVILYSLMWTIG